MDAAERVVWLVVWYSTELDEDMHEAYNDRAEAELRLIRLSGERRFSAPRIERCVLR